MLDLCYTWVYYVINLLLLLCWWCSNTQLKIEKKKKESNPWVQPNPSELGYVGLDPYDGLIFSNPVMMGHIEKTSRPVYTPILETSIEHYSLNTPNSKLIFFTPYVSLSLPLSLYIYIYISNLNSPSLSSLNLIFSLSPLDFASFSQLVHLDWCGGLVMELPYGL